MKSTFGNYPNTMVCRKANSWGGTSPGRQPPEKLCYAAVCHSSTQVFYVQTHDTSSTPSYMESR